MNIIKVRKGSKVKSVIARFEVKKYSERSIAVFGDTFKIKDLLENMGGIYNEYLRDGNDRTPGWIFFQNQEKKVIDLLYSKAVAKRFMKK